MGDLRLGVLGMSDGNGHPYSWSAIFNGYNPAFMKDCPFPVIYNYLKEQSFPEARLEGAQVTHIWTQDIDLSKHIAKSSCIPNVVDHYSEMIGFVDAILLARDDPENHFEMSKPFIEAGLPIFIDKPLSLSVSEAKDIFAMEKYHGQIYTCSSLLYAKEFSLSKDELSSLGEIKLIDATIPKSWEKYSVHIIEPVLNILSNQSSKTKSVINTGYSDLNIVTVTLENDLKILFRTLGKVSCPLSIRIYGNNGFRELVFRDTYYAFKTSLEQFLKGIRTRTCIIPRAKTLEVIDIIEKGLKK